MAIDELLAVRVLQEVTPAMSPPKATKATPADVIRNAKELGIKMVDLRFMDFPGIWQHFSHPGRRADRGGSSRKASASTARAIRGFQKINESDMLAVPDPRRAFVDPFSRCRP